MAVRRELIVTEVFHFDAGGLEPEDAHVIVNEDAVIIQSSDQSVKLDVSREEWEQIVGFVRWSWQPPTMGGRE